MELTPDKEFLMDSKIYAIPIAIMRGEYTARLPRTCEVLLNKLSAM